MDRLEQPTFEDLELLAEVSQLLTLTDLNGVLQRVIDLAAKAVGATKSSLFLHEGDTVDWQHLFTVRDLSADESVKVVTKVLDDGFAGWVYKHKRGDIIEDALHDDRWITFPDDPVKVRSALCVPFIDKNRVIAVVTLTHHEPNHFTPYHLRLMTIITNQANIAIRNAQLFNRLRSQRRQLETILQSISDVLLVLDQNGDILLVNDAALPLLDLGSQAEVQNRHLAEFMMKDKVFEPIVEIISSDLHQEIWAFESRSERHQIDYNVTMSVWRDDNRLMGYVIVMHDVTTLRDLHRFKDEMLQVASHDLRSPLALIAGYADMVKMDTPDPHSPIHDYVDVIKRSIERMGGLIDDLLRVERIRSSPLELHEQVDLEGLVKIVLVNMRPSALAKHQEFNAKLKLNGVPRISADPVLLRQAMENLISNAIKYTPEGGSITIYSHYDAQRFHFIVQDTGIGIPKEHQAYVFESFYRVKNSKTKAEKGSGLGLSLVKNVIARHSGEVWVKSRVNRGSRFGFWLPIPKTENTSNHTHMPDMRYGDDGDDALPDNN